MIAQVKAINLSGSQKPHMQNQNQNNQGKKKQQHQQQQQQQQPQQQQQQAQPQQPIFRMSEKSNVTKSSENNPVIKKIENLPRPINFEGIERNSDNLSQNLSRSCTAEPKMKNEKGHWTVTKVQLGSAPPSSNAEHSFLKKWHTKFRKFCVNFPEILTHSRWRTFWHLQ